MRNEASNSWKGNLHDSSICISFFSLTLFCALNDYLVIHYNIYPIAPSLTFACIFSIHLLEVIIKLRELIPYKPYRYREELPSWCLSKTSFTYRAQVPAFSDHPPRRYKVATLSLGNTPLFLIHSFIMKVVAIPYNKDNEPMYKNV